LKLCEILEGNMQFLNQKPLMSAWIKHSDG